MKWYPLFSYLFVLFYAFAAVLIGSRLKGDQVFLVFVPILILFPVSLMMRIKYDRWLDQKRYSGLSSRRGRA